MFTGIIEACERIIRIERTGSGAVITVSRPESFSDLHTGESISVNGACLTVTEFDEKTFYADISRETLQKTTLSKLQVKDRINLERSLQPDSRMGGHFVQGHVDGTGIIKSIVKYSDSQYFQIELDEELIAFVVPKGSIAVDGISLTAANIEKNSFGVYVIPHTLNQTTLADKTQGALVNIEVDILGKYVKQFLARSKGEALDENFLKNHGF